MAKKAGKKSGKDKNYISVWQWLLLFLLLAIPCIGWILLGILAFVGDNETRKNYCRASIIVILFFGLLWACLVLLGFSTVIITAIQNWMQQHHWHF